MVAITKQDFADVGISGMKIQAFWGNNLMIDKRKSREPVYGQVNRNTVEQSNCMTDGPADYMSDIDRQ
jgi:hypothetical protein